MAYLAALQTLTSGGDRPEFRGSGVLFTEGMDFAIPNIGKGKSCQRMAIQSEEGPADVLGHSCQPIRYPHKKSRVE